jgi:hypothetical protein
MATIINTLEVVLEAPKQGGGPQPPAGAAQAPAAAAQQLTPADIADVAERRARLAARLAAH